MSVYDESPFCSLFRGQRLSFSSFLSVFFVLLLFCAPFPDPLFGAAGGGDRIFCATRLEQNRAHKRVVRKHIIFSFHFCFPFSAYFCAFVILFLRFFRRCADVGNDVVRTQLEPNRAIR